MKARRGSPARPYTASRKLFDALAAFDILAYVVTESREFKTTDPAFVLYSLGVLTIMIAFWLALRRHEYPMWAVVALQLTVIGHIVGRFVVIDGLPAYRSEFLGLRGDKVIHAFNSLAAAVFATAMFRRLGLVLRGWEGFIVVMTVSGAGALVEIVEYGGTMVLPVTHVGTYANNMQDLIANLVGALLGWTVIRFTLREDAPARPVVEHGIRARGA
ncbi:MAG: hypothetical protein ACYC6C_03165 [Coriobacteriia bacterium]